ncbi:G2/M phase-specific E3 ubiquitin-protein ligase-like [Glandiceps talaboti]
MIAVSLVHGGPGPHFFSSTLYDSLALGINAVKPTISDIANYKTKEQLLAILNANTEEQLRNAVENADALITMSGAGHVMPTLQAKDKLVGDISRFVVINRTMYDYKS